MRTMTGWLLAAALLAAAAPVVAHHAFSAEFDATKPVRLQGTITKMEWINPHSWMHVDVTNDDGTVDSWMIEAGPPGALVRRGWRKDSVQPGTEVFIESFIEEVSHIGIVEMIRTGVVSMGRGTRIHDTTVTRRDLARATLLASAARNGRTS